MTSRDGRGASVATSIYERVLVWAEGTRVPFADGFPAIRLRDVRPAVPGTEVRGRAPRPRSCSRTRTGGAASAVVLMMLGTGTLGALPLVNVHGRAVDTAATVSTPSPVAEGLGTEPASPVADQSSPEERPAEFTTALPDQRAQVAIRTAVAQLGLPYVWGGDGPSNGDAGFDCSGLTTFSYAAAGVGLPRTAHTQYYTGPHVPQGAALQPGDLVFYGTPARVHHVGMYLGGGKMVNAPTFGKPVQTAFYRWNGDDYLGATRPAATGTTTGLLPYAPAAPSTGAPEIFPAPTAPAPTAVPDATAPQPAEAVSAAEAAAAAAAAVATTTTATVTATPTASSATPTTSTTAPLPSTTTAAAVVTTTTVKPPPTTPKPPATTPTTTKPSTSTTTTPTTTSSAPTSSSSSTTPPASSAQVSATEPAHKAAAQVGAVVDTATGTTTLAGS